MRKKITAFLLIFGLLTGSAPCFAQTGNAKAEETDVEHFVGLDAQYHTQEEIRAYYESHPIQNMEAEFNSPPSVTAPYALGELTEETKQDALNQLNLYRYIAGVPAVPLSDTAQNYAQAAALGQAIARKVSHGPLLTCPDGMSEELYDMIVFGAYNSNLGGSANRLCDSLDQLMREWNGDLNFGHRRQFLKYDYKEAGFGMAQSVSGSYYMAAYVDANMIEDKIISYPGQNQPLEYFGTQYAWTVIVPEAVDESEIHLKLTDKKTGKVWNFDHESDGLRLDIDRFGACVIFSPDDIEYRDGDQYEVEITGISEPISYEVNMFLLGDPVPLESIDFSASDRYMTEGDVYQECHLTYVPANATNRIVTWTSSDSDIAEPKWAGTGSCRIIAKKAGTAVFTATSEDGGHTDAITIHVRPKATQVLLSKTDVTIGIGQSFELKGSSLPREAGNNVLFKGDFDKNIISLEDTREGNTKKITGKAIGQTAITAYAYEDAKVNAVCNVRVVEPVYTEEIRLDKTEVNLSIGDKIQLNASVYPADISCREIRWSSTYPNVASVSDGEITAVGPGQTVITMKALDGSEKETSCTVSVYGRHEKMDPPFVVSYTSDSVTLRDNFKGYCEFSLDGEHWQDSNVFEGLEPDHEYFFYVRRKEFDFKLAGEASDGTAVRTKAAVPGACPHQNKEVRNTVEAGCTENGYSGDTYCLDCGETIKEGSSVRAQGHDYAYVVTKEPTIEEEGTKTYTCRRCGHSYAEAIPKRLELSGPSDVIKRPEEANQPEKPKQPEASQSQKSESGKTTAKTFMAGAYQYRIINSSSVEFAGIKNNKTVKVTIPKTVTFGGKKYNVTAIAANALNNTKMTRVIIGTKVRKIGKGAFLNCKKLNHITIKSAGLKSVGKNAFKGINKNAKIKVPAKKLRSYKKLLKGKGQEKQVRIIK